ALRDCAVSVRRRIAESGTVPGNARESCWRAASVIGLRSSLAEVRPAWLAWLDFPTWKHPGAFVRLGRSLLPRNSLTRQNRLDHFLGQSLAFVPFHERLHQPWLKLAAALMLEFRQSVLNRLGRPVG